jgi:hypothetical protein
MKLSLSEKHYRAACKAKSLDHNKAVPKFSAYPAAQRKGAIAGAKLMLIVDHWNKGHIHDYTKYDQWKYMPYFEIGDGSPAGFRFNGSYCDYAGSYVGSRLSYVNRALSDKAGKELIDLYRDLMIQ